MRKSEGGWRKRKEGKEGRKGESKGKHAGKEGRREELKR